VSIRDIARQEQISDLYLQQLFARLRRRKLVKSVRGPGGGFILARHPSQITIGEIIRSAEGKESRVGCRKSGRTCGMIERCRTQNMWDTLEERIDQFLDSISVEDLFRPHAEPAREAEG